MWLGIGTKIVNLFRSYVTADGPFNNHETLTDGLVSYWALDETSGVRYDSVAASANDLSDNNTVESAAGQNGNAASFVNTNLERLSCVDSNDTLRLDASVGMGFAAWVNITTGPAYPVFIARGAIGSREYELLWTGNIYYLQYNGGAAAAAVSGTIGDWHLIVGRVTPQGGGQVKIAISLDGAAYSADSAAFTPNNNSGGTFQLSSYSGGDADANGHMNGLLDEVGIWNRPLIASEVADLWNSGAGLFYGD